MDGKAKAIIAHIYWVGWVIALIMNSSEKDELASFYIRQLLGLFLFSVVIMLIPVDIVRGVGGIVVFVFWIISLIGAIGGQMKEVPWVGKYFQEWFKAL